MFNGVSFVILALASNSAEFNFALHPSIVNKIKYQPVIGDQSYQITLPFQIADLISVVEII